MEEGFKEFILKLNLPEIGNTIPENAELIFTMPDQAGDDTGDGDYTYPNQRFKEGVFDLLKTEIFRDDSNVYFRFTFANMTEPVTYRSGGELFMPGVVIAINKGGSEERHLGKYGDGVQFGEDGGYDIKINVGDAVSFTNPMGRACFTSPSIGDKIRKIDRNVIEFSIPIQSIGEPDGNWKFSVGTGLVSNRTMNFSYAGLMPVLKEGPPVYIKGGNYNYWNPAFIDILLPGNLDQEKILGNYNSETGKIAVVPMIGIVK
jgi:carbohydrate-binding DOMON domain-containing protein